MGKAEERRSPLIHLRLRPSTNFRTGVAPGRWWVERFLTVPRRQARVAPSMRVCASIGLKGSRDGDSILDRTGLVLSDKSHGTTRIRKVNDNTLEVVMTIEDPKALTKPWVVTKQFRKLPVGTRLYDYGCAENNRNPVDEKTGKTLLLGPNGKPLNIN